MGEVVDRIGELKLNFVLGNKGGGSNKYIWKHIKENKVTNANA